MDGVILLEPGPGASKNMCAKVWSKRRLCGGRQPWFWGPRAPRDGVCEVVHVGMDGVGLLEQGRGASRKHVRQSVVQNAAFDMDINIGSGVLGHLGMGLTSWCLWGMDGVLLLEQDLGQPKTCAPKFGAKCCL